MIFKPPFEIYRDTDIADQNGHVCTAENKEIAREIIAVLNEKFATRVVLKVGELPENIVEQIRNSKMTD